MGFLVFLFTVSSTCSGQETIFPQEDIGNTYVHIITSAAFPKPLGNNFLSEAYNVKPGFMGELSIFFEKRYFIGYQGIFNTSEVENTALVGQFDKSRIQHHYIQGGYSFLPRKNSLGITAGIGLGLVLYTNFKEDTKFSDNGFSYMANAKGSYRFSKYFGFYAGVQLSHDNLNIQTAPEIENFFKNTNILFFSVGLVLSAGQ